jgi:hypothetical protein
MSHDTEKDHSQQPASAEVRVEERRRETLGGSYLRQELMNFGQAVRPYPRQDLPAGVPEKQRMLLLAAGTSIARGAVAYAG